MATGYPDTPDTFGVPSLPEDTPLSQAGPGNTRNLVESVEDIGDAVEALERQGAHVTHDHSGVPGNGTDLQIKKGSKLKQANTHEQADTDIAASSLHHTLGRNPGQAAAGDRIYDYSEIANVPYVICTSSTRPTNPLPGMKIYETDTNRERVWSLFPTNSILNGLFSVDYFTRSSVLDLNTTLWEQTYDIAPSSNGRMATPSGTAASWIDGGNQTNRCIARRIHPSDAVTDTDDQLITWKTGSAVIEDLLLFTENGSNDVYFRMSSDKQSYVRLEVGNTYLRLWWTTTGKANEKQLGALNNVTTNIPSATWSAQAKDRTFTLYRNGELIGTVVDTQAVTSKGAAYRGWGMGMVAGQRGIFGQTTPANVDWISIQDSIRYISINRWTLQSTSSIPSCRLRQSKAQKLVAAGSIIEWSTEIEDNFDFFNPASPTDILVTEPGLYQIDCAVQWDPRAVPDQAHAILLVNGIETDVRNQQFMRGQAFQPGFSQTLPVSGKLRFAAGDILQLKAKYTASGGLLDLIFSFFDAPSKINTRIDLIYLGP